MATAKTKRNANRKALRRARDLALVRGEVEENIDPAHAMQFVLDRAFHMLRNAEDGVGELRSDEVWVETMVGKIPNEWIRLETDLRREVTSLAGKMLALDIDSRNARTAEILAATLAPVLEAIFEELRLTPKQEKRAPKAVRHGLRLLEAA